MLDTIRTLLTDDHDVYDQLREYTIIVAFAASFLLVTVMFLYHPKFRLDKAVFLREVAILFLLGRFLKIVYIGPDAAIWTPITWGFLAIASILVLVELVREHFLILPRPRYRVKQTRKETI